MRFHWDSMLSSLPLLLTRASGATSIPSCNSNYSRMNIGNYIWAVCDSWIYLILSIHPSIHLPVHSSTIHSSTSPFIHLSIHLFIHPPIHLPTYPSTHPSIHPPIHPSTTPFIHLSIHPFIHPSIHPSNPNIQPLTYLSIHPPAYPFCCLLNFCLVQGILKVIKLEFYSQEAYGVMGISAWSYYSCEFQSDLVYSFCRTKITSKPEMWCKIYENVLVCIWKTSKVAFFIFVVIFKATKNSSHK